MKSAEIREFTEQMEQKTLSSYAALAAHSRGRTREEPSCPVRTVFQRDRDRIIHSRAFRRLKHKTQVFLAPEGDHYRTRLTHTLEVNQIARTIARALRLNEDLTEAIALGHDLGHTPFGHAGERALDSLCPSGFRHYQQSIRVVEHLEKGGQGLNLTYEVKNGIVCHTSGTQAESLEGRVVRLADKIAYINHDIEDACRAGVLTEEQIPKEVRSVLGDGKSVRINRLVLDVIENSERDILMSNEVKEAFFALHSFMFESVYTNPQCKGEESKAIDMLVRMYEYFISHPMEMPNEYLAISWQEGADRAVCDYLAGMSDYYALRTFKELFIPLSWRE